VIKRLFIPDTHAPFHDQRAYRAMLAMAQDFKPHEIVYLGDFHDTYCVSSYSKNPDKMVSALDEEFAPGIELMQKTEDLLRPSKSYYLLGNHEDRLDRYIRESAPIVRRLFRPWRDLLALPKKMDLVPYNEFLQFDDLYIHHGISVGKHCTHKMLDKLGANVLFGHTHKLQSACKTVLGRVIRSYSCGWLGDAREIEYQQEPDYQLGFATGLFPKSGKWDIQLHAIQSDYTVTALGKTYEPLKLKSGR
jgi:predicted phosphodiesterase